MNTEGLGRSQQNELGFRMRLAARHHLEEHTNTYEYHVWSRTRVFRAEVGMYYSAKAMEVRVRLGAPSRHQVRGAQWCGSVSAAVICYFLALNRRRQYLRASSSLVP